MRLHSRLSRLERSVLPIRDTGTPGLPPQFWGAIDGSIPPEQLSPEMRQLFDEMCVRGEVEDTIEKRIREVEARNQ